MYEIKKGCYENAMKINISVVYKEKNPYISKCYMVYYVYYVDNLEI